MLPLVSRTTQDKSAFTQAELVEVLQAITVSKDPSSDLISLKERGILQKVIPEFEACWGPKGEQEVEWHPEGNVWVHTLRVIKNAEGCEDNLVRLAAAFHDIGKPLSFHRVKETGRISSHGHEYVGANLFEDVIGPRLGLDKQTIEDVAWLCSNHMLPQLLKKTGPGAVSQQALDSIVNHKLARQLILLHKADANGAAIADNLKRDNSEMLSRLVDAAEGV